MNRQEGILAYLREHPVTGTSAGAARAAGCTRQQAWFELHKLEEAGLAERWRDQHSRHWHWRAIEAPQ